MTFKKALTTYLPIPLYDFLRKESYENHVSMNKILCNLLEDYKRKIALLDRTKNK